MNYTVYAGGPISGLLYRDAIVWRDKLQGDLAPGIKVLSPMRDKEFLIDKGIISGAYDGQFLADGRSIVARDLSDIDRSDIVIFNFLNAPGVSVNSHAELGYAYGMGKPIFVVIEQPHPSVAPKNPNDGLFLRQFGTCFFDNAAELVLAVKSFLI